MQVSPAAPEFRPIIGSVKKLRKLVIAGPEAEPPRSICSSDRVVM
jgi:hypothetical protein